MRSNHLGFRTEKCVEQNGRLHGRCSETSFSSEVWQPLRDPPRPPNVRVSRCVSSPDEDPPPLYSFRPNLV
uniref:Uncharacterized protein n=1 Tax=Steinernema glaseri TaxID=37863 RepID=A0A1I8A4B9_9BILA